MHSNYMELKLQLGYVALFIIIIMIYSCRCCVQHDYWVELGGPPVRFLIKALWWLCIVCVFVCLCVCLCLHRGRVGWLSYHSRHIFHKPSEAGNYFSQPKIDWSEVDSMHVLQGLGKVWHTQFSFSPPSVPLPLRLSPSFILASLHLSFCLCLCLSPFLALSGSPLCLPFSLPLHPLVENDGFSVRTRLWGIVF